MNKLDFSHQFLGPHDADDDKNLRDYYVQFGDFSALQSKKKFFVVGAKGTGKSAIKEYVRSERKASRNLVVAIDDRYSVPLSQLQTSSAAEIKNKMKGYITGVALQNLLDSPEISDQRKMQLKGFQEEIRLVKRILAPVKFRAPFAEYAIKDLFQPEDRTELLRVTDPQLAADIKLALGDQDLWILIDDIDRIFTSDNERATLNFVEGLVYAASDLNLRTFEGKVFIVLLLRSEIYDKMSGTAADLDKELQYVWELSWDAAELKKLLTRRIEWALAPEVPLEDWQYWTYVFEVQSEEDTKQLQDYLFSKLMNGPRDLLMLVDYARELAAKEGASRISQKHIEESEFKYGSEKLRQIVANFGLNYPSIDSVIERLFRKAKRTYSRSELEDHVNDNLLTKPAAMNSFAQLTWLGTCTAFALIKILYRVGVIGYLNPITDRYVFVLEDKEPERELIQSDSLAVHSAFSKYLQLEM